MAHVSALTDSDHDDWLPLWLAYLDFYATTLDQATTAATFTRLVDPASVLHGALLRDDAGTAVGVVHWLTHEATWTTTTYCYLEDLFVDPSTRGKGFGRELIAHVRAWAEDAGCHKVYWLTAETNTTARALYDTVATRSGMIQYQIPLS